VTRRKKNVTTEKMIKYGKQGNMGKHKSTVRKKQNRNMRKPVVYLSIELSAL